MNQEEPTPIILYEQADQAVDVRLDADQSTVWLTQAQMADLFDVNPQNITMHLKNIYSEGELVEEATCKDFLQVQHEGGRDVKRKHCSLDAVMQSLQDYGAGEEERAFLRAVSGYLNDLESARTVYQQELTTLAGLKQSLLQKAFSIDLAEDKVVPKPTLKEEEVT